MSETLSFTVRLNVMPEKLAFRHRERMRQRRARAFKLFEEGLSYSVVMARTGAGKSLVSRWRKQWRESKQEATKES